MPIEIERKFLVLNNGFMDESHMHYKIVQGFLSSHKKRTVRVRITGSNGFLTIKGKSNDSGTSRFEWEKEIPVEEADSLLELCEKGIIDKTRYLVKRKEHTYEIDVFHGENDGLILAEIELNDENETFEKPNWLGKEVTGDIKYYNAVLSKNPFSKW